MSYFLPHLPSGWHVDQAILAEENRVVIIRFGHDWVSSFLSTFDNFKRYDLIWFALQ